MSRVLLRLAAALGCASLLGACGPGTPSVRDGERALKSVIDGGDTSRLALRTFAKTDGRPGEVMGVKVYSLMFTANAAFVSAATFSTGNPLTSEGSSITTTTPRAPKRGFSWDDFLAGSQGFRPAGRGDQLQLIGSIDFEKRESGWTPTGIQFRFTHDSSTRARDFTDESLEFRNFSMKYASQAAPHVGLVGGFRTGDRCLSIEPPRRAYTGRVEQTATFFDCVKGGRDVGAAFELAASDQELSQAGAFTIRAVSQDTLAVVALAPVRNGCSTCGFSDVMVPTGEYRYARAFEVFGAAR